MKLHEYQAKKILKSYGAAVPNGLVAGSGAEAAKAAKELGGSLWVVKAQVHAGGRGKAGGVKLCRNVDEVQKAAEGLIGTRLVTHQTTAEGQPIHKVYVEEGSDIDRELYVAITLDRATSHLIFMVSSEGGMDIEEVAAKTPEKIFKETIEPLTGLMPYQCRNLAFKLGIPMGDAFKNAVKMFMALYRAYMETDASMVEINPLILTKGGEVLCLDGKIDIDGNALYRQSTLAELADPTQDDPREAEAAEHDLNYIALDGSIGCMVNGAGLAMATMDIIKHYGGSPANFLDVGGGATEERVTAAFKIILSDSNVKGILVNIFGGIMKCDVIARGVVAAAHEVKLAVPLVVRLEGTNVEAGKKILAESGLAITTADSLDDAAQKVVAEVKNARAA